MREKKEIKEDEGKKQRPIQIHVYIYIYRTITNPCPAEPNGLTGPYYLNSVKTHSVKTGEKLRTHICPALANSVDPDQLASEQLIWIYTVCHSICELVSTTWIKLSDWLTIRSGHGILFSRQGFTWPPFPHLLQV